MFLISVFFAKIELIASFLFATVLVVTKFNLKI